MSNMIQDGRPVVAEDFKAIATDYLRGMGMKLPQKYAKQFIDVCQVYGLNPVKRECYAVGYGDNWNIIVGYEVYIKRAERIGKMNGWSCFDSGSIQNGDLCATLEIHRKDWQFPFKHVVYYDEEVQKTKDGRPNKVWEKRPRFMLKKVCIAQGFRLCFPDELGGMPYTPDELSDELPDELPDMELKNVTPEAPRENSARARLNELLDVYREDLKGTPSQMAQEVLSSGQEQEVEAIYKRCVDYLGKKGIKVA